MNMLDIEITLKSTDPVALAAHAHSVMVRLLSWPGLLCAGSSLDTDSHKLAGVFRLTPSGRRRFQWCDLERTLRADTSVVTVEHRTGHSDGLVGSGPFQPTTGWLPAAA